VAGSDGLFDNMWDAQLLSILAAALSEQPPGAAVPRAASPPRLRRTSSGLRAAFSRRGREAPAHPAAAAGADRPPQPPQAPQSHGVGGGIRLFRSRSRGSTASLADMSASVSSLANSSTLSLPELACAPSEDGFGARAMSVISSQSSGALTECGGGDASAGEAAPPVPATLVQRAADALARAAHRNAGDEHFKSPWAAAAGRQGLLARLFAHGGKMDDCTCVVAMVRDAASAAAASTGVAAAAAGAAS
jgi:hypothetical protein